MEKNKGALVPLEPPQEDPPTPIEQEYQQSRTYFKESLAQAAKTNLALITVLGIFVVRGLRYAWAALRRYLPWARD